MGYKPCIDTWRPTGKSVPILIVGEAPGEEEEASGVPFVGPSGRVLNSWMELVELDRNEVWIDNVFHMRPKDNKVLHFFCRKSDDDASTKDMPRYHSKVVKAELYPELRRLRKLIKEIKPKVVVSVGSCATWALTGEHLKITEVAGKSVQGKFIGKDQTVVPIVHPSYFLRTGHARYRQLCVDGLRLARKLATK